MKKIVFLASGNGGTLKSVYYALERLGWDAILNLVVADRECGALDFARSNGIRAKTCSYHSKQDGALYELLRDEPADLIVTNIHKIITKRILDLFPGRYLNLHYSLLPSFGGVIGMRTLDEAKKQNVQWVGATSHVVDELVDHGRILGQCVIRVDWQRDSLDILQNTIFRGACMVFLQSVRSTLEFPVVWYCDGLDVCGKHVFQPLTGV